MTAASSNNRYGKEAEAMVAELPPPPVPATEKLLAGRYVHASMLKRSAMDAKFAGRITAGECAWLIQFYGLKHA